MELWIRSQDKTKLDKASGLYISGCEDLRIFQVFKPTPNKFYIHNGGYIYGEYKTKERCLEIVDEIQDALCGNVWKYKGKGFVDKVSLEPIGENVVAVINKEIIELKNHDTFVYEMPKE